MRARLGLLAIAVLICAAGGVWLLNADSPTPSPVVTSSAPRQPGENFRSAATVAAEVAAASPPEQSYPLDLAALRAELPNNLYWSLGAPTADPAVEEARAADARQRNERFGRVQSGEATEDELHAYFEGQRRLHQDYLDFSLRALERYGPELPERDQGLYQLSARLHRARLAELPELEAAALERKRAQDRLREAWQAAGKP